MTTKDFGWILARSFESKATSVSEILNNFFVFEDNGGNGYKFPPGSDYKKIKNIQLRLKENLVYLYQNTYMMLCLNTFTRYDLCESAAVVGPLIYIILDHALLLDPNLNPSL